MQIKGQCRAIGHRDELAMHLLSDVNEQVRLFQCQGLAAGDLVEQLREMEAWRGQYKRSVMHFKLSPLPSVSREMTDDQWRVLTDTWIRHQKLEGHAVTFVQHRKAGRVHMHAVVAMRGSEGQVYRDGNQFRKNKRFQAALVKELPWLGRACTKGVNAAGQPIRDRGVDEPTFERARAKKAFRPDHAAQQIREIFDSSPTPVAFVAAMNRAGYAVCAGNSRVVVAVDPRGGKHSLSRRLAVKPAQVETFFGDFSLPRVPVSSEIERARQEQYKSIVSQQEIERDIRNERLRKNADRYADVADSQLVQRLPKRSQILGISGFKCKELFLHDSARGHDHRDIARTVRRAGPANLRLLGLHAAGRSSGTFTAAGSGTNSGTGTGRRGNGNAGIRNGDSIMTDLKITVPHEGWAQNRGGEINKWLSREDFLKLFGDDHELLKWARRDRAQPTHIDFGFKSGSRLTTTGEEITCKPVGDIDAQARIAATLAQHYKWSRVDVTGGTPAEQAAMARALAGKGIELGEASQEARKAWEEESARIAVLPSEVNPDAGLRIVPADVDLRSETAAPVPAALTPDERAARKTVVDYFEVRVKAGELWNEMTGGDRSDEARRRAGRDPRYVEYDHWRNMRNRLALQMRGDDDQPATEYRRWFGNFDPSKFASDVKSAETGTRDNSSVAPTPATPAPQIIYDDLAFCSTANGDGWNVRTISGQPVPAKYDDFLAELEAEKNTDGGYFVPGFDGLGRQEQDDELKAMIAEIDAEKRLAEKRQSALASALGKEADRLDPQATPEPVPADELSERKPGYDGPAPNQ